MPKSLHLKIILLVILSSLTPLLVSLFFIKDPFLSILTGLLSAILSIGLIFLFLKPLKDLTKSTENFINGNLNQRVDIKSGDEFEAIGNLFNNMAEKLSKSFESLEKEKVLALAQNSKLEEVLSSIIDGIVALDFNKNIIFSNKVVQEMTGFSQSELLNQSIEKVIHVFADNEEVTSQSYCQADFSKPVTLVGKMGRQTKINILTVKVVEERQTNLNCILILHDLSKEEELEKMKLDFVSMASHELRTPLTSIVGYLSVFISENKGKIPKEELDLVEKAMSSARELLILVQNILSVNKIERVKMSMIIEPTDYWSVLSKVVDNLRSQSNQKNIVLNLIPPTIPLPKVLIDKLKVEEVITNLVANAINYTNPGGKVEVSVAISPNEITTTVSDTGVGIPKEAIPNLFNKFFRVSNSSQKMSKGTGLGLYIAKSIVEKLNGKIWVESEIGRGSKFYFTLPVVNKKLGALDTNEFIQQAIQSGVLNY